MHQNIFRMTRQTEEYDHMFTEEHTFGKNYAKLECFSMSNKGWVT